MKNFRVCLCGFPWPKDRSQVPARAHSAWKCQNVHDRLVHALVGVPSLQQCCHIWRHRSAVVRTHKQLLCQSLSTKQNMFVQDVHCQGNGHSHERIFRWRVRRISFLLPTVRWENICPIHIKFCAGFIGFHHLLLLPSANVGSLRHRQQEQIFTLLSFHFFTHVCHLL